MRNENVFLLLMLQYFHIHLEITVIAMLFLFAQQFLLFFFLPQPHAFGLLDNINSVERFCADVNVGIWKITYHLIVTYIES